jgi:hypothetical protein
MLLLAQMELMETFIKVLDRDMATGAESVAEITKPRSRGCLLNPAAEITTLSAESSKIR